MSVFGSDFPQSEPSVWRLTNAESEVFDFLHALEIKGYLESDGFISKKRYFKPTRQQLPKGKHR